MMSEFPHSVEEAGALLGASITTYGREDSTPIAPPSGMHSAFSTRKVASAELLCRLRDLRSFLRSSEAPLVSAPSILALLNKILPLSTKMANSNSDHGSNNEIPILLSNPLRKLWVDCVVLCHVLNQNRPSTQLVRKMSEIALLNPRSQKAAGGIRVAALDVIAGLFAAKDLAKTLAPWTLEVLNVCNKAMKSAGTGEPSYRISAVRTACATVVSCRQRKLEENLLLPGSMEPPAIVDAVRLLRTAMVDKIPAVRSAAATLAAHLAPLLVTHENTPPVHLDEVLQLCWKNMDDETPAMMLKWSEAWVRCSLASIVYNQGNADKKKNESPSDGGHRFVGRRLQIVPQLSSLGETVAYLVDYFCRIGGESTAQRFGGAFSVGGRNARVAIAVCLVQFLSYRSLLGDQDTSLSAEALADEVLKMLDENEKVKNSEGIFTSSRNISISDRAVARECVSHVLRHGLSSGASEGVQGGLLAHFVTLLKTGQDSSCSNSQQRQVILGEISHLVTRLGLACKAIVPDVLEIADDLLIEQDPGVRTQTSYLLLAVASSFPEEGPKLLQKSLNVIREEHASMMSATSAGTPKEDSAKGIRFFRRSTQKEKTPEVSSRHQNALHGWSIFLSYLVRTLPSIGGRLEDEIYDDLFTVSEIMLACQFNRTMCESSPAVVCTCVRGAFLILSGVLASNVIVSETRVLFIADAWKKCVDDIQNAPGLEAIRHQIFCLDVMLASVVTFLKFRSELLLTIPDILNSITGVLEGVLPLFTANSRYQTESVTGAASISRENARASLLEAYAWLPPGSFPVAADDVFNLSAQIIQDAGDQDMPCSLLRYLVDSEDEILDVRSLDTALIETQVGRSSYLTEVMTILSSDALHFEMESVSHLLPIIGLENNEPILFRSSAILGSLISSMRDVKVPSPLHEVGGWKRPVDPSTCSKTRLIDAAIQAFASTFGLKDGAEQQKVMDMLEAMLPPFLTQLARSIGVNTVLVENDRRGKTKEDLAAVSNIVAVLLSCLQALPLHDSTHNVSIGMGPPWMNKAKDLLLTLLPSTSSTVRRAAAEGLAHLATLGVSEEAHMMQSKVLLSLDEVMHGNKPEVKRALSLQPLSVARSGALLTLGSIQRTAWHVVKKQDAKARSRVSGSSVQENGRPRALLPFFQMLARALPSIELKGVPGDTFIVRANALHSIAILLSYSNRLEKEPLSGENQQLLLKAVDIIQRNFIEAWTLASNDLDRVEESDKLSYETTFLATLLRLSTYVVPAVSKFHPTSLGVGRTFSVIASLATELHGNHPVVSFEALALSEMLGKYPALLGDFSVFLKSDEIPVVSLTTHARRLLARPSPSIFTEDEGQGYPMKSTQIARASAILLKSLLVKLPVTYSNIFEVIVQTLSKADQVCGSRLFRGLSPLRSLASRSPLFIWETSSFPLEQDLVDLLAVSVGRVCGDSAGSFRLLMLLSAILTGNFGADAERTEVSVPVTKEEATAITSAVTRLDVEAFASVCPGPRWQVRTLCASASVRAFQSLLDQKTVSPWLFCLSSAQQRIEKGDISGSLLYDVPAFHVGEIVSLACMLSSTSLDTEELFAIQEPGVKLLGHIIEAYHDIDDPEMTSNKILDQFDQQMLSSVRQALVSSLKGTDIAAARSFAATCGCLLTIIETGITTDPNSLKRLCRPLTQIEECLVKLHPTDISGSPWIALSSPEKAKTCANVVYLSRICLAKDRNEVLSNLISEKFNLAISASAIAVSGASLLLEASRTLCGDDQPQESSLGKKLRLPSLFHSNFNECDSLTRSILSDNWSGCALLSIQFLTTNDISDNDSTLKNSWLKILIGLVLRGAHDALSQGSTGTTSSTVMKNCLESVSALSQAGELSMDDETITNQLKMLVEMSLIFLKSSLGKTESNELISAVDACGEFLIALSRSLNTTRILEDTLLAALLNLLKICLTNKDERSHLYSSVKTAVMKSLAEILQQQNKHGSFLSSIVSCVLEICEQDESDKVLSCLSYFLRRVLQHNPELRAQGYDLAEEFARQGEWCLWSDIASVDDFSLAGPSSELVADRILHAPPEEKLVIIHKVFRLVQDNSSSSLLVRRLVGSLGPELQTIMLQYGISEVSDGNKLFRQRIFTESIRFWSVVLQRLSSEVNIEEEIVAVLLGTIFNTILPALRFNGLPRHPRPNPDSDDALGRLSAQFILKAAKLVPSSFKQCVLELSENDRQLLEYSLRAEMTGYENSHQSTGGPKKKLNMSGFKRATAV